MSYERIYDVLLHDRVVGGLYQQGRTLAFAFDEEYREDPHRAVLGFRLDEDVRAMHYAQDRLPAWFANLLPEGQLRELLELSVDLPGDTGRSEREIELLEVVGADLPGAVKVVAHSDSTQRDFSRRRADAGRSEGDGAWRFSVAGVGLKLSLLRTGRRFTAPVRGSRGDWLVKLPDRVFPALPENEFAVMSLAAAVGIDVPSIDLVHRDQLEKTSDALWAGESLGFAIERFDRTADGESTHIEDFAQVRGLRPEQKYEGNFETVANIAFRGHDEKSLVEFTRRMALSLLVGNSDAHLKNWSFIYPDRRNATLSPAYDLVSVVAYSSVGIDTSLALRLANRKQYEQVKLAAFSRLAAKVRAQINLDEIVAEVLRAARAEWEVFEEGLSTQPEMRAATTAHAQAMYNQLLGERW